MSKIKTLSDEIDVSISTSGLVGSSGDNGYVLLRMYQNSIGVFSGQSYVTDGTPLVVNINDFASQNDYDKDYLKLLNDGTLTSTIMKYDMIGTYNVSYRFNRGAISNYKVRLDGNNSYKEADTDVLCGYDYVNTDLQPSCVKDEQSTYLCRLMTGCQWIWDPSEHTGSFINTPNTLDILPHYPYINTDKYGIGISLYHPFTGDYYTLEYCETEFALRMTTGDDYRLGMTNYVTSNTAFVTLKNFIECSSNNINYDSDNIYLKLYFDDNDEFGTLTESSYEYMSKAKLGYMKVHTWIMNKGDWIDDGEVEYPYGGGEFASIYTDYINPNYNTSNNAPTTWPSYSDLVNINAGVVYETGWYDSSSSAQANVIAYENNYGTITKIDVHTKKEITPMFFSPITSRQIPPRYNGNCIVGIFDRCPAKYYLAWNDRYGDLQSQPFDGKFVYSEDIKTEEIIDYKSKRRVSNKSILPKWKLNTKWINEDVYPFYESIFTSPYLLLYDTEQDKAWNVIITDDKYEEKTFKNKKSLFNLEINVEANKTNNLIY